MGKAKSSAPRGALLRELEQVERQRQLLLSQLGEVDAGDETDTTFRPRHRSVPVRDMVLNAIEDLGCLAFSREVMLYAQARYGRQVPAARFGTLSKDEQAAYDSKRPRAVFLAHGLTSERFEPIKRLWARSDWPLWMRIVAPTTGRVQHLQMTVALCRIAISIGESAADPEMLKILAADHARDVPGVAFKRGQFPLEDWCSRAQALLDQHEGPDRTKREEAALRFEQRGLPARAALFGAPEEPALFEVTASADDR